MRPSSDRIGRGEETPGGAETPLSLRVRTATSKSHRGLEAKTGWPDSLCGARDVSTMLQMFRALHASVDAARGRFAPCFRRHGFDPGPAGLAAAIDDDLRTLGIDGSSNSATFVPPSDFDAALGLDYVAAGSALGNLLLLRHLAAHPDPSVVAATRFLRLSSGRAPTEFRAFRVALDAYGLSEPEQAQAVIEGANAAFRGCVAWLDATSAG